jgi:glycosyltransferase involved in cell wall biosynthesis
VCSTSGWAHWIRGQAPRVVYCHTPARWLYEAGDYFKDLPPALRTVYSALLAPLRAVDRQRMRSAAAVVANGPVTAERIRRVYDLQAPVIVPPPGIDADGPQEPVPGVREGFFLTVSRPRSYKNLSLITSAFVARQAEQLVVVGGSAGPATDSCVLEVGRVSDAQLRWLYQNARAVVCVAREDLGLVPIEAFQFGTPAVALRAGGYLATCAPGRNAVFVETESAPALNDALDELRDHLLDPNVVRESAQQFSVDRFLQAIDDLVAGAGAKPRRPRQGRSELHGV